MNTIDIITIIAILSSGIFAFMRGFVYEILATSSWVISILIALWSIPAIRPFIHSYITNQILADIVGGVIIFIITLILSRLIIGTISQRIQKSSISSVDRSIGFIFGILRGLIIISICFIILIKLMEPNEPQMLSDAKTRPLLSVSANIIQSLLPAYLNDIDKKVKNASDELDQEQQLKEMYNQLASPKPKSSDQDQNDKSPSYDSHSLKRLIETTIDK
ncbi:MAG: CvpA family protein [Rhodospirillaceae bacterium]|jgi:membrane protein required for colicin V production|nr:CvpA family protein [Rhodospirillaceae bacterium]